MSAEAPITSREGLLAWIAAALRCSPDKIHDNDSLIALGMSSLMMMRLPVMLKKAGVSVKLADLLKEASLESWIRLIQAGKQVTATDEAAPAGEDEPFALTDMQRAYWFGRQEVFSLGGIASHGYLEIECADAEFDVRKLEESLNRTIAAHPMLKMRLTEDGRQKILKDVPHYTIEYSSGPDETLKRRAAMQYEILPADVWPLFRVCMTGNKDRPRKFLHISFDILLLDIASLALWLGEWYELYKGIRNELSSPARHFSQYIAEIEAKKGSKPAEEDKDWWNAHIATLPRAPQLPLTRQPRELTPPTILRQEAVLEPELWNLLKHNAAKAKVTPAGMFAAVFAEVLSRFSRSPDVTLNLTLFDRSGERSAYDGVLGDFTSMLPVPVYTGKGQSFSVLSQAVHAGICQALSHGEISGTEVSAEIARVQGFSNENPLPVVLTCAAGSDSDSYLDAAAQFGTLVFARNQAPQTWIDAQVVDYQGGLWIVWDYVRDLLPDGMIEKMFGLFIQLIRELKNPGAWHVPVESIHVEKQESPTLAFLPGAEQTLFAPFLKNAACTPDAPALITPDKTVTYGELEQQSGILARHLLAADLVRKGDLVGVALPRGWRQVVAVLAVLRAGAAYLPVNVSDPKERLAAIFAEGDVSVILTEKELLSVLPESSNRIVVDEDLLTVETNLGTAEPVVAPEDVAYVIFTSGSTGTPKGVVLSHASSLNTIIDINCRNAVNAKDRLFAVSQLNFDLSVYDIFGALAVGAALVMPRHSLVPEPLEWVRQIRSTGVTVWNSVPALAQLVLEAAQASGESIDSLRIFMLSGDWLPVELAHRILNLPHKPRLVSMGGATEAAIWSVEKVVEGIALGQKNVPYGKALSGQTLYVLDAIMRPCPVWVPGEIYIAGVGLAEGYFRKPEITTKVFVRHPLTGERLYRTGDWGRWLPDGDIEFLGREDTQVKISGMRIELGEIEAALSLCPRVKQAVAVIAETAGGKKIAAFVLCGAGQDVDEQAIRKVLKEKLPGAWVPAGIYFEAALPLTANGKVDRQTLVARAEEALHTVRPDEKVVLHTNAEQQISNVWASVLGGVHPGVDVSFFDAGGTSFLAMQLASRLTAALGRPVPVVSVFQYTTIISQAKHLIEPESSQCVDTERGHIRAQKLTALAARARRKE